MLFAAYLAQSGIAYNSIKVYFSAVGNWHSSCSQHTAYQEALTPRLEQVLRGIKREQATTQPARVRLPITAEIMARLYLVLSRSPSDYLTMLLWAACNMAFFGFLRVGEMTVPSQTAFDDSVHLSLEDISVDNRSNPSTIWLTIKQSKTDPFRIGVKLCLARTHSVVCPVKAILPYLAIRGSSPGPLFIFSDGSYLTRPRFKALLSATLTQAGLDDSNYNTHSFRIGAATSAKSAGISDTYIQLLGRWKSAAYRSYIRTPAPVLRQLSMQLVSTVQETGEGSFTDH